MTTAAPDATTAKEDIFEQINGVLSQLISVLQSKQWRVRGAAGRAPTDTTTTRIDSQNAYLYSMSILHAIADRLEDYPASWNQDQELRREVSEEIRDIFYTGHRRLDEEAE